MFQCPAITEYKLLSEKSANNDAPCFICTDYFIKNVGHLPIWPKKRFTPISCMKRGQYKANTTLSLKFFGNWIEQTSKSKNDFIKIKLLKELIISFF